MTSIAVLSICVWLLGAVLSCPAVGAISVLEFARLVPCALFGVAVLVRSDS